MNIFKKFIFIVFTVVIAISFDGCSKFQQSKHQENARRKQFERDKKQKDKEAARAYKDAINRHYSMQDRNTQKMMRETAKKSQLAKDHKKPNFLKRWFTPKQKKGKSQRNAK
ncbi:MAG: hypothetical protein WCQ95_08615 [Bacteroidota bacterium]